uniref:leucine-rich repeat domain-containing protein n=2 Tax=Thaumasiovibrio subtropicus TaxID=1891207 RepID=UPI000B3521E1|nr:leucine-rich repeat domain-containing protein [Thaumasiovibrio subtropicus]
MDNIGNLGSLKYLHLQGDIKFGGDLPNSLEFLSLNFYRGNLEDRHCGLDNLIFLSLPREGVLKNCDYSVNTKLKYFYMNKVNSVIDIKLPKSLVTLQMSDIKSNDIDFLSKNIALENLYLLDTEVKSLKGAEYLTNLSRLEVRESKIDNLKPLSRLQYLRVINIQDSNVSTLNDLSELVNLEELYLDGANITHLSGIPKLVHLKKLRLYDNPIREIDVSTLEQLKFCYVSMDTNTQALKKYPNLDEALYQLSSRGTLPPLQ